jgi:hypothetical protein
MNGERKMKLFHELVRIGFKEIEVGFPAASQTDFDFVRRLIDENLIPDDVTIMVMTQSREDLIARTVEAVKGAPRAIVHLYNATAPAWRRIVFGMNVTQVMQLIAHHVGYLKQLTDAQPGTQWTLQYSPETFSATELNVSLTACQTAIAAWNAGPGRPIIINLPTTVENATPNVFADQIEWMHRHLVPREHIVLSVHPHNDRGTGVAAAELAMMAGADRVEGCLFGNGERCGWKADLDLLEADAHQLMKELHLALAVHGLEQRLVAVAQIGREPDGGAGNGAAGPLAVRQIDGGDALVLGSGFGDHHERLHKRWVPGQRWINRLLGAPARGHQSSTNGRHPLQPFACAKAGLWAGVRGKSGVARSGNKRGERRQTPAEH